MDVNLDGVEKKGNIQFMEKIGAQKRIEKV
jgi:hypothetical protein